MRQLLGGEGYRYFCLKFITEVARVNRVIASRVN